MLILLCAAGCKSKPTQDEAIPLPGFGDEGPARPKGVYAVIRRADIPLDQPTDDAWAIINEQIVPPVTRGAWRGNGLRLGLLPKDKLDAYSKAMPELVAFGRILINMSDHRVPIIETPRLRSDLLFDIDLTQPPRPRLIEKIKGGDNSTLRLLARIETEADGRHSLVLTPQHYIPSPFDLVPRSVLDKEMDGRVYDELTVRLTPGPNQIAVVSLYWPWPQSEVVVEEPESNKGDGPSTPRATPPPADPSDPAAPPPHLTASAPAVNDVPQEQRDDKVTPESQAGPDESPEDPTRYQRIAPPLPNNFGSTLFTGTRIRQPIRVVLLITIEEPNPDDMTPGQ